MKRFLIAMVAGMVALQAQAWQWGALSVPEMAAHGGATHVALFSFADFTNLTVNTDQVYSNVVPARTGVECVGLVLDTPYDTGNTNFTGSCALKIGDGSDDDLYLTSTELASDGTEVYVKYGPANTVGVTAALATNTITYINTSTNFTTNTITYISSVTAAGTVTELNRKLYTNQGKIVYTFTPNSDEALGSNIVGQVRVYFREIQWGK